MAANPGLRFLRPYIWKDLPPATKSAYLQFYNTTRSSRIKVLQSHCARKEIFRGFRTISRDLKTATAARPAREVTAEVHVAEDFESLGAALTQRVQELKATNGLAYPRIRSGSWTTNCSDFKKRYASLNAGEVRHEETVVLCGMPTL